MRLSIGFLIAVITTTAIAQTEPTLLDNQVQFLYRGDQSLAARLDLIENAQKTIDMTSYIFEPCDASTKLLMDAMIKKANPPKGTAPVKIRLVIDAYEAGGVQRRADMTTFLKNNNIELRYYNKGLFAPGFGRSHVKLLIADGAESNGVYVSGGRNISDGYFGLSEGTNYLDQDFSVRGKTVKTAQAAFNNYWDKGDVSKHFGTGNVVNFNKTCLNKSKRDVEVANFISSNKQNILSTAPTRQCAKMAFVMDDDKFRDAGLSEKDEDYMNALRLKHKHTTRHFLNFINDAETSLLMHNQYYIPTFLLADAFKDLRERKIKTIIYTNLRGDAHKKLEDNMSQLMLDEAKKASKSTQRVIPISSLGSLNAAYELTPSSAQGQWRIHTKTTLRDHKDIFLGSFNIDQLSYSGNLEEGMMVFDCPSLVEDVAQELTRIDLVVQDDLANCKDCKDEVSKHGWDLFWGKVIGGFF